MGTGGMGAGGGRWGDYSRLCIHSLFMACAVVPHTNTLLNLKLLTYGYSIKFENYSKENYNDL